MRVVLLGTLVTTVAVSFKSLLSVSETPESTMLQWQLSFEHVVFACISNGATKS